MWNKRRTISGGCCSDAVKRPTEILPVYRGVGHVRSLNAIASHDSNATVYSYIVELCKIAINLKFLSSATLASLKNAEVLVGSRRIRRQRSDGTTDPLGYEEDWDVEYSLLAPNQVAIADDMITLQQFGEEIFCAPQEEILESEHNSIYP